MEFNPDIHVEPYRRVDYLNYAGIGYLVWRVGTGGNVEILHLRIHKPGEGHGRRMLGAMLRCLSTSPPYATVFGFTRTGNTAAQAFYRDVGFTLTPVYGVYDEGDAVVFSARYSKLLEKLKDTWKEIDRE